MELKVGECFLQLSQMFCGTWMVTMTPYLGGDSRYQNCSRHIISLLSVQGKEIAVILT